MRTGKKMISVSQAVILLITCQLFGSLLFSPLTKTHEESSIFLYGSLLAILLTALLLLPVGIYFQKYPEGNLLEDCRAVGSTFGRICCFLYFLLLMGVLLHTAAKLDFFITVAIFPKASSWVILIAFLIAAAYGASMGLEGLARAATIIAAFFAVAMLLIDLSLIPEMERLNLKLPSQLSFSEIGQVAWEQVSNNMALAILVLLMPRVKGRFLKVSGWFVLLAGLLTAVIFAVTILVLGNYLQNQSFPVYSIASIAKTELFQRLDAIQMSFWVLIAYIRMSIYLLFATELLQKLLPRRAHKGAFWGILSVVLLGSVQMVKMVNHQEVARALWGADILLFVLLIGLPLIVLWKRGKENGSLHSTISST